MHEITGRDHVILMEGHPLSGMGNWHRLGEVVDWDDELQHGLAHEDIRRVLGVGEWEIQTVGLADLRKHAMSYGEPFGAMAGAPFGRPETAMAIARAQLITPVRAWLAECGHQRNSEASDAVYG